jgi:hypothetical protein
MKVEISNGELADKVTILEIKLEKIKDPAKLGNVRHEYDLLVKAMEVAGLAADSDEFKALKEINLKLWDIEDRIRLKERSREFDDEFVSLARAVYVENDKRFGIKMRINRKTDSKIIEEKEYVDYDSPEP